MDRPQKIDPELQQHRPSILIVDDLPENLELLVQILQQEGYSTRPALNAQLALGAVTHTRPDLILLDIRMPEMDGFELCDRLKKIENGRDVPVIFISAIEDIDEKVKAFEVGGVDYITRPFQKAEVLVRVRTHLELAQMRKQMASLVRQRTQELQNKTQKLKQEIKGRKAATEELKASEQKYRLLVENIHQVFCIVTPDLNEVHYISPAYEKIWGRSCQSLYSSPRSWLEAVHPEDLDEVMNAIPATIEDPETTIIFPEFRIRRQDDRVRWISARAFPIMDADGSILWVAGIAEDITHKLNMENRLRQSHKMEAIGRLAGGIAHEFNNVLGIIIGNTELAMDDLPDGHKSRGNLEEIKLAGLRARDVVKQLLDFNHKSGLRRRPLDIGRTLKETLKLIRASLPATIKIIEEGVLDSTTVMADHNQLQQLFINITTNAFQAMGKSGGTLTIGLSRLTLDEIESTRHCDIAPGSYVVLSISDTGQGITPEIKNKIFDPYFTTQEIGQGTGMGLTVAHGIVKSHGGIIEVDSTVGRGTTFRIFLPIAKNNSAVLDGQKESLPTGNEKILFNA